MRSILTIIGVLLVASPVFAQGEDPLKDLLAATEKDADALVSVGHLFVEAERLKEAKKIYQRAQRLDKKSGEVKFGLAKIEMAKGSFHKAKRACRKIAIDYKSDSVGSICSGWFWLQNNRGTRADVEFLKAIELGDRKRGDTGMGEVHRQRGDFTAALEAYARAIDAGAGYVAHLGRGLTLERTGDRQGAVSSLEKAVQMQPASCLANYHYGRLLEPGEKSLGYLETALAMKSDWVDPLIATGNVHMEMGNVELAISEFRKATEEGPKRGDAFFALGRALYKNGQKEEAKEALERAIEIVPSYAEAYLLIADILKDAGDIEAAGEALKLARQFNPKDVSVYFHSGEFYFQIGRNTTARSFLNKTVGLDPRMSAAYLILGQIACGRRLYDEAQAHFKRALDGDMTNVDRGTIDKLVAECVKK